MSCSWCGLALLHGLLDVSNPTSLQLPLHKHVSMRVMKLYFSCNIPNMKSVKLFEGWKGERAMTLSFINDRYLNNIHDMCIHCFFPIFSYIIAIQLLSLYLLIVANRTSINAQTKLGTSFAFLFCFSRLTLCGNQWSSNAASRPKIWWSCHCFITWASRICCSGLRMQTLISKLHVQNFISPLLLRSRNRAQLNLQIA